MNEINQENDKQENRMAEQKGPGSRLRAAREALKIPIDEVAKQLHLMPTVIRQIENNQFQLGKGNLVFIKGYLRSYAKFLNLPQEEVLNAFNELNIEESDDGNMSHFIYKSYKKSPSDYLFKIVSALIIAGLLLMALLWWRSQYSLSYLVHSLNLSRLTQPSTKNLVSNQDPSSASSQTVLVKPIDQSSENDLETSTNSDDNIKSSENTLPKNQENVSMMESQSQAKPIQNQNLDQKLSHNIDERNWVHSMNQSSRPTNAAKKHSVVISPPFQ